MVSIKKVRAKGPQARNRAAQLTLIIMTASLAVMVLALMYLCVVPPRYDLEAGMVSADTIYAPREIEDTVTTNARKEAARNAVPDHYIVDDVITADVMMQVKSAFLRCIDANRYTADWREQNTPESNHLPAPTPRPYTQGYWTQLYSYLPEPMWKEQAGLQQLVCTMTPARLEQLRIKTADILRDTLNGGVRLATVDDARQRVWYMLGQSGFSIDEEARLGCAVVSEYLVANTVLDAKDTEEARQLAAEAVERVVYPRNRKIVGQGDVITEAHLAMLSELGLLQTDGAVADWQRGAGLLTLLLLVFGLAFLYIVRFEPQMRRRINECLMLCLIVAASLALCFALSKINLVLSLMGVTMGVLLMACLLHTRMAIVFGFFLSVFCGMIATGAGGMFTHDMLVYLLAGGFSGQVGVLMLNKKVRRQQLIACGLGMAGMCFAVYAMAELMAGTDWLTLFNAAVGCFFAGVGGAVLVLGTLTMWETLFGVATPMKLMDLANPDRPLLRRMVTDAPGTYSHSVSVANLAEQACERIGANALLARVGAYYHDIGKLSHPTNYIENQFGSGNPHDSLTPQKSAELIRAHVTDGIKLARRCRLPEAVAAFIPQHHGTTVIQYFYQKAREEDPGVNVEDFRYAGPRPRTREAAVVMLADSVEAAVKALHDPSREMVEACVNGIAKQKMQEDQFDECDITMGQLHQVTESFIETLRGFYHERITYGHAEEER